MTNSSLRVIGLAYRKIDSKTFEKILECDEKVFENNQDYEIHKTYSESKHHGESFENDLIFTGLLGIMDPPRKEAVNAIADCQRAGINVVMITGDHKDTATAIAMELGILPRDYYINEKNYHKSILISSLMILRLLHYQFFEVMQI